MNDETRVVRILVVDDYEPFRQYFCTLLGQVSNFQVIAQASDGLEAIEKAQELQPDLILLDVLLPKLNGLEAARQILKLAPLARIVFVSQEFYFELVEEALTLGGSGYVHKLRVANDLLPAIESTARGKYFVSGVVRGGFGNTTLDKPPIRHDIQLCIDDADCVRRFTDFAAANMELGKAVIVIASEAHQARIMDGLNSEKWDVKSAVRRGLFFPLDFADNLCSSMLKDNLEPAQFFDIAGEVIERAARTASREQSPLVAVCRECPPSLLADGNLGQTLRLERLWSLLARTSVLDMLCLYPAAYFEKDGKIFQRIRAEHSG